ncbi:MAG: hypothetical protein PHX21_05830 [bacterium]|nr:hypothetical protein [bacterium]
MESKHFYKEGDKGHQTWALFNDFKKIEFREPQSSKLRALVKRLEEELKEIETLEKIEYWITELDASEPVYYIVHTVLSMPTFIRIAEDFVVSREYDMLDIVQEIRPELEAKVSKIIQSCKNSQRRRNG